jgi:hypothetical protein
MKYYIVYGEQNPMRGVKNMDEKSKKRVERIKKGKEIGVKIIKAVDKLAQDAAKAGFDK